MTGEGTFDDASRWRADTAAYDAWFDDPLQPGHVSLTNGFGPDHLDESSERSTTGVSTNELTATEDRRAELTHPPPMITHRGPSPTLHGRRTNLMTLARPHAPAVGSVCSVTSLGDGEDEDEVEEQLEEADPLRRRHRGDGSSWGSFQGGAGHQR
jgi:hypothetical protein